MTLTLTSDKKRSTQSTPRTTIMNVSRSLTAIATAALSFSIFGMIGCSAGMPVNVSSPIVSAPATAHTISGVVYGGQSPIALSSVYLFAVGTGGYGAGSVSMLTAATGNAADGNGNYYVVSSNDGYGTFSITGDYSCSTAPGPGLVYLLAVGGNPGSGVNAASTLMAPLGLCSNLSASTYITMNEETTVAAVYALAPYMTLSPTIGVSAKNIAIPASDTAAATGISNAFAEAFNLVNVTYGVPYVNTPAGNGIVPTSLVASLANVLASCVNTSGPTSPGCVSLFTNTTTPGTSPIVPADTIAAVLSMAQNPSNNVSNLISMDGGGGAPFAPVLSSANDLTMAVKYTGYGINTPQAVAIDGSGNAWVSNAATGAYSIVELGGGSGAPLTGASGYTNATLDAPTSIAIDTAGKVWVTNCAKSCVTTDSAASSVTAYTLTAGSISGSTNLTTGGLNGAYGLALDASNNAWVANALGTVVSEFNGTGAVSSTGYTSAFLSNSTSVAVDTSGNVWAVSPPQNSVSEFTSTGGAGANSYQGGGLLYPFAVAIDATNRPWIVDQTANKISVLSTAGVPITGSPFSGGGLSTPTALALDGSGTAWIANGNGTVSAFTVAGAALSGTGGYQPGSSYADGIAVDGSGSVWVTDCGAYCGGTGSGAVYQLIGAGIPVATPLAYGVANSKLATKP